jgi:NADPH:quinone reductase-like Zn-dependent oxidoreductase
LPFQTAASVSNLYGAASALILHLHLDKPSKNPKPENKEYKILIWGASSSFGIYATQLAREAGYTVVGVASKHNEEVVRSSGAAYFVNRRTKTTSQDLITLGPYKAVLAAADSAEDQVVIGEVLAALGGGSFLSTMGVRPGVNMPAGVTGLFAQYLDDYLDPKNKGFTEWVWWEYMEDALQSGQLKLVPVRELGGLSQVQTAWNLLKHGKVSGERLVISPDLD